MTHAVDYARLQRALQGILQEQFVGVQIVAVQIDEDIDYGDGRLLEITVFFEGTSHDLADGRPLGLTSLLEERLAEMSEAAFPVLSFVSASEQRAS